jgi:hypothetical protein
MGRFEQALARLLPPTPNCRAVLKAQGHPALMFDD